MSDPAAAPPAPRRHRWWLVALLVVLALLAMLAGAIRWGLYSESGSRWLLQRVPGLAVQEPRGALLGGDFAAKRLQWSSPDGRTKVDVDGLVWRGLTWRRAPHEQAWVGLRFDEIAIDRVVVQSAPSEKKEPPKPPQSLRLPVEVEVARASVGALHLDGAEGVPIRDIAATRLHAGADAGARHAVEHVTLARDPVLLVAGSLGIGADAPFALDASAAVASLPEAPLPWRADATVRGPLERLVASATLSARGMSADAKATLLPFAAWPLPAIDLSAKAIDVSALVQGAPLTALDVRAHIETEGLAQPARIDAEVRNAAAGLFNAGRVPVRSVAVQASARPDEPQRIDASSVKIEFGDERHAAGSFDGAVSLDGKRVALDGRIANLQPERLDARAQPMTIDGPVAATLAEPGAVNRFELTTTLTGALPARAKTTREVKLELDAGGVPADIELRRAVATAGDARAELSGRVQRLDARVVVDTRAKLERFDPRAFWQGPAGSPLARGPHRINATANVQMSVMPPAGTASIDAWLAALDGKLALALTDSVVAGIATRLQANVNARDGRLDAKLALDAAGNRARIDGSARQGGAGDRWQLELDAPRLAALAPLAQLASSAGVSRQNARRALAGALDAKASVSGRWPRIASEGRAAIDGFAFDDRIALARGEAQWNVGGTSLTSPVDVRIDLTDASLAGGVAGEPPRRIDVARVHVDGTLAAHRFDLRATSPLRPPSWVDDVAAVNTGDATVATLRGSGRASDERYAATIDELRLGGEQRDGGAKQRAATVAGARGAWLAVRDLRFALDLDPASRAPVGLAVEPGSASALGAAIRWQRVAWNAPRAGRPAAIDVAAQVEPIEVAPLLSRLQPTMGWSGDLAIGARIDVKSAPSFAADVVVERARGDLAIADLALGDAGGERPKQRLGITTLRLALDARDGNWQFTQALAGSTVGVVAGAVRVKTVPTAIAPPPDAPIDGVLVAEVGDLGVWSSWVPPGWRLGGSLRTTAQIGGRVGAPEYTGNVNGRQLAVRNLLEGVDLRDGELDVALQGTSAKVERFVLRGGDGRLTLDGNAAFGAAPRAQLKLAATKFEVLSRVDRRVSVSGGATMRLDADAIALEGRIEVDEGLIDASQQNAPALSDDVVVVRDGAPPPADDKAAAPARGLKLDLYVDLGDSLRIRGRGIDTRLAGELHITAPKNRIAVNGTVRTVEGRYAAYGQDLTIERGLITFTGPVDQPRLDILALRPKLDVKVGVAVSGGVASPRVRLYSEPAMSDTDKLSWLILGRAPDGLGRSDAALLQRAALGALSGENPGAGDKLTSLLGLDEFSVGQAEGDTRDTVVTLGKQLGERWFVGYERGLNATAGSWQLIYRVARRFTLRGQSGLDNSIDAIWTWRWD